MKKFRFARSMVIALVWAATLVTSQSASAAEARLDSGGFELGLQYWSDPGATNDLRVSFANGEWTFVDPGVTKINSGQCRQGAAPNIAVCPFAATAPLEYLAIYVGDLDDTVQLDNTVPASAAGLWHIVSGGEGDDFLIAGTAPTTLRGEAGNNRLIGGSADDRLSGGTGNDTFRGGAGGDSIQGGTGRDSLTYGGEGRTNGVRVVLDGVTRSGRELVDGDGDVVGGIEDVAGTPYTDILTGNASNNVLRGNGGVDQLTGLSGDDTLIATGGPSWLDGGDGNDLLQAKNTFKDFLGCGLGTDTAKVDPTETFVPFASCETLTS